jgi:hypothetical protein
MLLQRDTGKQNTSMDHNYYGSLVCIPHQDAQMIPCRVYLAPAHTRRYIYHLLAQTVGITRVW